MTTTDATRVRNVVGREPKSLEQIVEATGLPRARAEHAVKKLWRKGKLKHNDQGFYKSMGLR